MIDKRISLYADRHIFKPDSNGLDLEAAVRINKANFMAFWEVL